MNEPKIAGGVDAKSNLATDDDAVEEMGRFRAAPYKQSRTIPLQVHRPRTQLIH